jgi:hypothetical protein
LDFQCDCDAFIQRHPQYKSNFVIDRIDDFLTFTRKHAVRVYDRNANVDGFSVWNSFGIVFSEPMSHGISHCHWKLVKHSKCHGVA